MTDYEKKKLETSFKSYTSRNFERPEKCRNIDQIRYYVQELYNKIKEYEIEFNYVPEHAYILITQYNQAHNSLLYKDFRNLYA